MAGFHVFQDLFAQVDAILQNFVTSASAKAVAMVAPFVAAAFVIVLLWDAFNAMMGRGEEPISKLIMKCLFWSCILSAALTAGAYQSNIADIVRSMPNDVAAEMSPGNDTSGDSVGSLLDKVADNGITKAKEAFNAKTGNFEFMKALTCVLIGVGILLATLALTVTGGVMLLMATTAISFLAALGPFFIAALLFESTRNFFWSWVSQVIYWVAFMVMFALFVNFTMTIFDFYMQSVKVDGVEYSWVATAFACKVVAVFGIIMFFWIPKIAAGLTQGHGGSVAGAVGGMVRTALTTLAIVKTAGAAGAAKAGMSTGSAVNNSSPPRQYNRA
ncbi:type IV secretion system protein [Xanthomonas phaseoli]|uniref:type IV secretion system protein n=1 Tax=Xanthomonas phaseoli TaxID=1985254 RepID=UPI00030C1E02|nr:type IV secretion system protein [Xanthomonas phaseoli]